MKKRIYFVVLVLALSTCFLPSQRTWAQSHLLYEEQNSESKPSSPEYVALLFYKMTAQIPDFDTWARQSPVYKEASIFNRMMVLEKKIKDMQEGYNHLSLHQPLIVEMPVRLSGYSHANGGFFIENFKTDTFFPITYRNQSYAIVPEGIMDKQWIKVGTENEAKIIEMAARKDIGRFLMLTLFLSPEYADKTTPISLNGRDYWLILTNVKKMFLTPLKSDTLLWQSDSVNFRDEKSQKLLDLYR